VVARNRKTDKGEKMKKKIIMLIITLCFITQLRSESVDVNHFLLCPSVNGISGFVYIPSAYVLPSNTVSLGLHRFEFKANYALFNMLEAGLYFDFSYSSNLIDILKAGKFNIKFHFLDEEPYFISMAAGIQKAPLNIFEKTQDENFNLYIVISKKIMDANITIGFNKNLTGLDPDITDCGFLVGLSKVIYDTVLIVAEYNNGIYNAGFKISMNSNITIDIFIKDIGKLNMADSFGGFLRNYFVFGINYIQ